METNARRLESDLLYSFGNFDFCMAYKPSFIFFPIHISSATVRVYLDGEILSGGYTVKYDNGRIEENYEIAGISQDKQYTVIGENEIIEYRYDSETSEWKGYEKYISEFDYPDGFSIGADIRFHLSGVGPYDDIENHFDEITYSEEKNAYVLSRREKYTESDVTYYYTAYTYYKYLMGCAWAL